MIPPEERPRVWAVHMLICGKEDQEIYDILRQVKELNIGLVCCPHAAGSMRQMRNIQAPLHSSIAPVRECLAMGIPVRFGTDNTDDHLMPLPKLPLLVREVDTLTTLLRYYELDVLYKLARGEELNSTDLASVAASLADDYKAYGLPNPWAQFSH